MTTPKTPTRAEALAAIDGMLKHLNIPPELQSRKLQEYIETIRAALSATDAPIVEGLDEDINLLSEDQPQAEDDEYETAKQFADRCRKWEGARDRVIEAARLYAQGRTQSAPEDCPFTREQMSRACLMFPCGIDAVSVDQWFRDHASVAIYMMEQYLSAAPPVTGGAWLPIESAEKKDKQIYWGGHWLNDDNFDVHLIQYRANQDAFIFYPLTDGQVYPATHYQPMTIPAPPSSAEKEGTE